MKIRSYLGTAAGLLLVVSVAHGDAEKVFRLKNGRKIQGEVLEETPTTFVVRSSSGKTTIQKDSIDAVEETTPDKTFLAPEKPATAEVTSPTPSATTDPPPPSRPIVGRPSVASATDSELAAAKKSLAAVPAEDGTETGKEARKKAIEDLLKKVSLAGLVAVVAEPETAGQPSSSERLLAFELVKKAPALKIRPLLVAALYVADFNKGHHKMLLDALTAFRPDTDGTVVAALLARLEELRLLPIALDDFGPPMAETRAHKHLPLLYSWLLDAKTKPECISGMVKVCLAVLSTADEPDVLLTDLMTRVLTVEDLVRLRAAMQIFRDSEGGAAPVILTVIRPIEAQSRRFETVPADMKACLVEAYYTLAWLPDTRGHNHLAETLRSLRSPELRTTVLDAISRIKRTETVPTREFLDRLLSVMDDGLSESEMAAGYKALGFLTGKRLGNDMSKWKRYVEALTR